MGKLRRPINVNHRRSLSSVFKTVKTRYSRDKLDKNEIERPSPAPPQLIENPELMRREIPVIIPHRRKASPPPCLAMPSDLVARDTIDGPSTFRVSLEKAVQDINNKYGTPSCAQPCTCCDIQQGLEQNSQEGRDRRYPMPISFPLSSFCPRYKLPTFMDAPAPKAKSTIGELRDLSSTMSAESIPLEVKMGEEDEGEKDGGCHLPTLLLNEAVGSSFDLGEFMTPQVPQAAAQEPVNTRAISAETGDSTAKESNIPPLPRDSTHIAIREASKEPHVQVVSSFNHTPVEPAPVPAADISSTISSTYEVDCLPLAQKTPLPTHQRQRSNSEQAPCSTRGSSIGNNDRESLFSDVGVEMKRARAQSTPDHSECSSVVINSRHPSNMSGVLASPDENIPSVSDLVRKFRRMSSLPGVCPPASSLEAPKQHPAIRRVSRGKEFEHFRNRFSSDSEACSMLSSSPRMMSGELHQTEIPKTAYEIRGAAQL